MLMKYITLNKIKSIKCIVYLKSGDSLIAHLNMLRDEIQILVSQVRGSESKNVSNN